MTVYASCNIQSPTNRKVHGFLGTGGKSTIWLNGQLVFKNPPVRGFSLDEYAMDLNLVEGLNSCLIEFEFENKEENKLYSQFIRQNPQNKVLSMNHTRDKVEVENVAIFFNEPFTVRRGNMLIAARG